MVKFAEVPKITVLWNGGGAVLQEYRSYHTRENH